MDALKICGIGVSDPEQIVRRARQQIAFEDLGMPRDSVFESVERGAALLIESDEYERDSAEPGFCLVEHRDVMFDETLVFKGANAAVARRGGKVHPFGEIRVRKSTFRLQETQNLTILVVASVKPTANNSKILVHASHSNGSSRGNHHEPAQDW
jgi:hypothetical protein